MKGGETEQLSNRSGCFSIPVLLVLRLSGNILADYLLSSIISGPLNLTYTGRYSILGSNFHLDKEYAVKLSTKARYGLRSLLYLAEREADEATSVREIAEQENISPDYLEHLLHSMKNAGLVESVRGAAGGFRLAKKADKIFLKDIFSSLDEKILPVWCLGEGEPCPRNDSCRSRAVWDELGELIDKFLSTTSLAKAVSASK